MSNTRPTLLESVGKKGKTRQKWADIEAQFNEEGWTYVQNGFELSQKKENHNLNRFPISKVRPCDSTIQDFLQAITSSSTNECSREQNGVV